jgi:lipopolysaccharide/colanic/teichoic acid biosynthesis glycosyltransferase
MGDMATLPSYDLPETDLEHLGARPDESGVIRHAVRELVLAARPRVVSATEFSYGEPPIAVRLVKRAIDVVVASLGLLAIVWLFPLLALAIWIDSPGPIFYRQRRAGRVRGRDGRGRLLFDEFSMLKLRTMHPDAERRTGPVLASEADPRITRVGRVLRKTRLDELPQLVNVLKGEMSLVGPRPERPELFAHLAAAIPYFEERMHGVKPGITGFAQVSLGYSGRALEGTEIKRWEPSLTNPFHLPNAAGSEADDMRMKLLYDLAYVAALDDFWRFIRLEIAIIAKTPVVMLRGLGR